MNGLRPERVKAATGWRFAYLAAQGGLSTALLACLAHVLPPDAFAPVAVALGTLVVAQAVGDFGLSHAAVTVLPSRLAALPTKRRELLAGAARASLWAAAGGVALTVLAAGAVPGDARAAVLLIAPAAGAAVVVAGIDGLMRAEGEFRKPVELVLFSRLGPFLAVPVAALTDSASWASASVSAGATVGTLPAAMGLLRYTRLSDDPLIGSMAKAAAPLGVSQLLIVGSGRLNTVFLSALASVPAAATFEGAWRLYQLGLYVAGGLATAVAPFIGHAVGTQQYRQLLTGVRQGILVLLSIGGIWTLALLLFREPVSEVLFGDTFGARVADAVLPLALVTPLGFVAFLATVTMATSRGGRVVILLANAGGAVVNLVLVLALAPDHGARGGALAAALGVAVTSSVLMIGLVTSMRSAARLARSTSTGYEREPVR